jgi:hypothetical protein
MSRISNKYFIDRFIKKKIFFGSKSISELNHNKKMKIVIEKVYLNYFLINLGPSKKK